MYIEPTTGFAVMSRMALSRSFMSQGMKIRQTFSPSLSVVSSLLSFMRCLVCMFDLFLCLVFLRVSVSFVALFGVSPLAGRGGCVGACLVFVPSYLCPLMTSIGDVPLLYIEDTTNQRSPHGSSLIPPCPGTLLYIHGSSLIPPCPGCLS